MIKKVWHVLTDTHVSHTARDDPRAVSRPCGSEAGVRSTEVDELGTPQKLQKLVGPAWVPEVMRKRENIMHHGQKDKETAPQNWLYFRSLLST